MFGDTATRVLLAVIRQDRPTVQTVADEIGVTKSTAHFHLTNLHDAGMVAYGHGQRGALRPLVVLARTAVRDYTRGSNETAPSSATNADTGPGRHTWLEVADLAPTVPRPPFARTMGGTPDAA